MTDSYRPEGFRDVSTYLVLRQGEGDTLITFLKGAFGATEKFVARDADGRLAHAELRVGDAVVELGETAGTWTTRSAMHLFVKNVDAVHAQAVTAGAKAISPPEDHEYGERSSAVEDPAGNHWYIAQSIPASAEWKS